MLAVAYLDLKPPKRLRHTWLPERSCGTGALTASEAGRAAGTACEPMPGRQVRELEGRSARSEDKDCFEHFHGLARSV